MTSMSNNGEEVMERKVEDYEEGIGDEEDEEGIREYFQIQDCCKWVNGLDLKGPSMIVALQFPDGLLRWAEKVERELRAGCGEGRQFAILGDTSYGECCVDEVAAEHVCAEAIIHFGHTCLTPTERIPVMFVYTRAKMDVEDWMEKARNMIAEAGPIHVFYDVRYHHAFEENADLISSSDPRLRICRPAEPDIANDNISCGRICQGEVSTTIYCGNSDRYELMVKLNFGRSKGYRYDPRKKEMSESFGDKEAMKRFYLIEKARDAERIGILVGTLGASKYREIIDRLRKTIKDSGKKSYTFLVGKPNVAKLANFPEIGEKMFTARNNLQWGQTSILSLSTDVFVLVACPENSLVGSKEYMQPVITPFELDVALNSNREWSGNVVANFQEQLPGRRHFKDFATASGDGDVSLITGRVRNAGISEDIEDSKAVIKSETSVAVVHSGGGGEFLNSRTWRGLEQKLGETPVEKATEGRKGIASGYKDEGSGQEK